METPFSICFGIVNFLTFLGGAHTSVTTPRSYSPDDFCVAIYHILYIVLLKIKIKLSFTYKMTLFYETISKYLNEFSGHAVG